MAGTAAARERAMSGRPRVHYSVKRPPAAAYKRRAQAAEADMRALERENTRLRNALKELLDEAEQLALTSDWPSGDHPPGEPRLCRILARELYSDELVRFKRARKALGLPWWGELR